MASCISNRRVLDARKESHEIRRNRFQVRLDEANRVITDLAGAEHLILPGSFRKTVRLALGDRVSILSFNLSAGPTAQDVTPINGGGPIEPPSMAGCRASHVPASKTGANECHSFHRSLGDPNSVEPHVDCIREKLLVTIGDDTLPGNQREQALKTFEQMDPPAVSNQRFLEKHEPTLTDQIHHARHDWVAIDNGAPGVVSTNNVIGANGGSGNWTGPGAQSGGFDLTANGSNSQASNPFANIGSTKLDTVNDTVYADPSISTVSGNPVQLTPPNFKTVSTIINQAATGIRVLWKNPAVLFF
jgi:hypothetical protein